MSAPHLAAPNSAAVTAPLAEHLRNAYLSLHTATATATALASLSCHYRGSTGQEVHRAIRDGAAAIENAVRVHQLGAGHPFCKQPRRSPITTTTTPAAAQDTDVTRTADHLIYQLAAALTALSAAEENAETLIATDHHHNNQHGYLGGLGWDLQTAIDDARICVRTAILAIALATTTAGDTL